VAVIVTDVFAATGVVVIVNVVLVLPGAMVTLVGTCATDVLLLCSATTAPPAGAAPVKVIVPVELAPPTTAVGLLVIEERLAALTVKDAVRLTPSVAVIVAEVLVATPDVVTVNVVELLPAGTVTEVGTVAAAVLLLCRVTTAPPLGAAAVKVTVPVELFPPTTDVGLMLIEDKVLGAALMVRVAVLLTTPWAGTKPKDNATQGLLLEAVPVAVWAAGAVMFFHSTRSTAS
jgi:hypothetical protein